MSHKIKWPKEPVLCGSCQSPIKVITEVEYSDYLGEFFCNPDCATDRYFDIMRSTPLDLENLPDNSVKVVRKSLYYRSLQEQFSE